METPAFQAGLERLLEAAYSARITVMCAEAVWWRCHRSLIADCLKASGITVIHIVSADKTDVHPYTSAAQLVDGVLSYRYSPDAGSGETGAMP